MECTVVESFENAHKDHCVDVFRRADGTYGYEEWRREPEDPGRWYRTRYFSAAVFVNPELAIADASLKVAWFDGRHCY